jgi:sodium/proline symporter
VSAQSQVLLAFLVFVAAFMAVGIAAAFRTAATESDYILGGRSMGPFLVGLSAGATGNSGFIMFGAVGFGYTFGMIGLMLPLGIFLGELAYWAWLPARVNIASVKSDASTVPQLVAAALPATDRRLVQVVLAVFILVLIGSYASAQFFAAGKALENGFELGTQHGILLGGLIILSYCTGGGFRASVWTDLVQAGVIVAVTLGVLSWSLVELGGVAAAVDGVTALNKANAWTVLAAGPLEAFLFLAGFTVFGFGFSLSQPQLLVRIFAARDSQSAARAKWTYLGFSYLTHGCMIVFGVLLRVYLPDIQEPEQGLMMFSSQAMPAWLVGIVMAGIFSAIASTADSQMLVISSTVQHDLLPGLWSRIPEHLQRGYLYMITVLSGILLTSAALLNSATIFQIVIFSISILASTLGPVLLLLLLDKPLSRNGILAGLVGGAVVAIVWNLMGLGSIINETVPGFATGLAANMLLGSRKGSSEHQ